MSKKTYSNKKLSNKLLIPIILMIGFIPLIVHTYTYRTGLSQFDWFPNSSETLTDVFFGWKMIAIIIVGAIMLGIFLFRLLNKKETFQFETAFYLLFFYALFVAMSALFSPYKYWVVRGIYELFESVWVLFAYIILCYYTYNYVREEKQAELVLRWAGLGMLLVTLIGAFQCFGLDFFKSSLGIHLITDPSFWSHLEDVSFVMGEKTAYTTLYNPNYLSFYFGMLIPLAVGLMIASKKLVYRILLLAVVLLSVLCMKGSHSDSGWMALAIGVGIVILILLSRQKKTLFIGIGAAVVGFVALIAVCMLTPFSERLSTTIVGTYHMDERIALRSVETTNDNVILDIHGNKMLLSYAIDDSTGETDLSCTDENGTALAKTTIDEENLIDQLDDPAYAACQIQPILLNDMLGIRVIIEGRTWDFAYIPGDSYYFANPSGKLTHAAPIKSSSLFREDFMSGRGHIWNNTIPLLSKYLFVGAGANAYMLAYPQDDYIYHAYVGGVNTYDVKAHCWYLQQWVENGLLGLLLLIGFLGWYIVRSARIYRRADLKNSLSWVGIGLFTAVLVYIIAAVANDSNVATAPVFWGLLGLGMAVNRIVVEKGNLLTATTETETSVEIEVHVNGDTHVASKMLNEEKAPTNVSHSPAPSANTTSQQQASKKKSRKKNKNKNSK